MLLNIPQHILLFLSGVGLLQGILLAVLLYYHPRSDRSVNRFLALFILCISLPILIPIVQQLLSWQAIMIVEPFTVLGGPFLYLYVRSFKEAITWKKAWPHLVIFPLFVGVAIVSWLTVASKYPFTVQVPESALRNPLSYVPICIRFSQRLLYYGLALRALYSYQHSIRHLFSETSRIDLGWVRYLIHGYLGLVLVTILSYIMILRDPVHLGTWILIAGAGTSIYIYLATFKGLGQLTLWQLQPEQPREILEEELEQAECLEAQPVYPIKRKTGLQEDRIREIVGRILMVLEIEKLYQETELTLQQLADKLELPPHQLSQAINDGMNKNFYDLVNHYRVEEAKRLLLDEANRNYTILSVGFEAGFNSKTTFNTVFKKFTGLTPTAYRNHQKQAVLPA